MMLLVWTYDLRSTYDLRPTTFDQTMQPQFAKKKSKSKKKKAKARKVAKEARLKDAIMQLASDGPTASSSMRDGHACLQDDGDEQQQTADKTRHGKKVSLRVILKTKVKMLKQTRAKMSKLPAGGAKKAVKAVNKEIRELLQVCA